ncbi:ATP-binding protein [Lysobacter sp. CW239]|uniref:BbrUII/HgiDII family restriction enzyme n=1 Tax=Lysobacteraceae TaxID=32033 RepID=UPI000A05CADF|nr:MULTISPECIES: ATP-binding protein [Lysobacter]QOD92074.1 ATP-binding protein [Lysobacter sp. CW239]
MEAVSDENVVKPVESFDEPLRFKLHLNVLHHLGMKLYASAPSVLTELVANSWDAESSLVEVDIDAAASKLTVTDDGHGMDRNALQNRFLSVGYSRREFTGSAMSDNNQRRVMGRKGIGKLAMFSIAQKVQVVTQVDGKPPIGFSIDVAELEEKARNDEEYLPAVLASPVPFKNGHGTRIILEELNRSIDKSGAYLVPRLARRFGIIGPDHGFQVVVDGVSITRAHAGIHKNLQFLWYFDDKSFEDAISFKSPLAMPESLNGKPAAKKINSLLEVDNVALRVRGFIGTVDVPSKLGADGESINQISLFANGRLWQEDLLSDIGDTRYFNSYIVGEVHADFLDSDDVDRATSARESVIQHDPYYLAIRAHLITVMAEIRDQWDRWRSEVGGAPDGAGSDIINEWIESLEREADRKLARKLIRSIEKVQFYNDDSRNRRARAMLYRSTMVAFEKLRVKKALELLEGVEDVLSPEFQAIFATLDAVEESYFHEISHQRLEVIQAFESKINSQDLESVVQNYLLDHLWLLDPTWDRIQGTQQKEVRLSEYLKASCPDSEDGARLDIAYRMQSGRHVVVELKRPGVRVPYAKIADQCNRYRRAVAEYVKQHAEWMDGGGAPGAIAIYFVCSDRTHLDEAELRALASLGAKILTYETLILSARAAYESYYHSRDSAKGRLENFLQRMEEEEKKPAKAPA